MPACRARCATRECNFQGQHTNVVIIANRNVMLAIRSHGNVEKDILLVLIAKKEEKKEKEYY